MTLKKTEQISERESDYNEFRKHKDEIRDEANDAKTIVARAAELAVKAIADAAADAIKVRNIKDSGDHDLLIELKTRMEGLKDDIKELSSGMSLRLKDHEDRIKKLEGTKNSQTVWITIGTSLIGVLVAIMIIHLLK